MNFPFTSVTRWLLVVIGCVVLATAQPMSAAASDAPAAADRPAETIIYPRGTAPAGSSAPSSSGESNRSFLLLAAILLAAAGVWVFIQKRQGTPLVARGPKKLQVEETRSLGNRQYLVVASYEGKKFLLGVTTGQIQMLADLERAKEDAS